MVWQIDHLHKTIMEVGLKQTLGVRQIGYAPNWNIGLFFLLLHMIPIYIK